MNNEVVDVHAHILLPGVMGCCGAAGPEMGINADGVHFFRAGDYRLENVKFVGSPFSDVDMRLDKMNELGIDRQLISPNPLTYFYHEPGRDAISFNRRHNDIVGEISRAHPCLSGAASLPLQDPDESCAELNRSVTQLGLVASYVGTDINGVPLSDRRFDELWSEHERLGVPVVIHPGPRTSYSPLEPFLGQLELDIVVGFAIDEGLAVAHLLLFGVLDRHPKLHVHVAHGGGFAPYQKGRMQAALQKRPWGPTALTRPFDDQWSQLSFDTAVHRDDALGFLVATEGADRVLLGSNFAGWDLEEGYAEMVRRLGLSDDDSSAILGGNAKRIFGLAELA